MGWLKSLYTVIIVTCPFCLPIIISHDHLPIPLESSPCFVTLGFNDGCKIVWVPPDLYGYDHCNVNSELYVDFPFHFSLMMLWNVLWFFWFFQFVFVSSRHHISMSYLMLLCIISINVNPHCPWSRIFGFCNSSLVNSWFFFVTKMLIVIRKYEFDESSLFYVCLLGFQWGLVCGFRSLESECLVSLSFSQ